MPPKAIYDQVLSQAEAVGNRLKDSDMGNPTPDTEWTVRDLVGHTLYELVWIPDIMAGKTPAEVGTAHEGDLIGADVVASWQSAIEAARQAVQAADPQATAHLSYTDKPIAEYLLESADDVLIHSWDLGQAIGVEVRFDPALAEMLYEYMAKLRGEFSGGSLFSKPIDVPESADIQTKLLALLGRSETWRDR